MTSDAELLRRFAESHANDAFAEVVRRHLGFVYTTALRQVKGDAALASDVTQQVFIDLARKSGDLAHHRVLVGWLHTSTRYAATQRVRSEQRRRRREQTAHAMNQANQGADPDWSQIRPIFDELLGCLKPRERDAILLRFFERQPFAEIGERLAITESAARSCVDRALEKLQRMFASRGITSTTAALGIVLSSVPATATPPGLAAAVTGAAVASAGSATTATALGLLLAMSKLKIAVTGILLVAALATITVEVRAHRSLGAQLQSAQNVGNEISRERDINEQLTAALRSASPQNAEAADVARLSARVVQLERRPDGVVDSEMHPLRNVGRTTPEAAVETYWWAADHAAIDVLASFVRFSDDTSENRAAFMANFSEAIRRRYGTPERIVAAGTYPIIAQPHSPNPDDDVMQVFQVSPNWRPGLTDVRVWNRRNGREYEDGLRIAPGPDGWTEAPYALTSARVVQAIQLRLDPSTGDRKGAHANRNRP